MSKPNINIPAEFAPNGVRTPFSNAKVQNGFDRINPDVFAGDNLNQFIDDTYKGLNGVLELYEGCVLYDSTVTYTNKSLVFNISNDKIELYHSLQNNNVGNLLTDTDYWKKVNLGGGGGGSLFDFKWSDHLLNDIQWLRGDTFSWQDGSVYVTAYNHLVDDITGKSLQTETIAGYTISYYLADDGHKIAPDTEETDILGLYNDTGIAWYYILDTTNERFKLPRDNAKHGELIEKYSSGTEWYRVYSDGWCEQGGQTTAGITNTFLKPFTTTNYSVSAIDMDTSPGDGGFGTFYYNKSTTSIAFQTTSPSNFEINWSCAGYISTPTNQYLSEYKYLYFYVGEYEQSAVEQTAGLNADLFNAKVDLNASNLNAQGQSLISGLPMPSDTYEAMTVGASGSTYTAPANGWFVAHGVGYANAHSYMYLFTDTSARYNSNYVYDEAQYAIWLPVLKGDVATLQYYNTSFPTVTPDSYGLFFVYAQGSESEA